MREAGGLHPFTGRDVPWLLDSQAARRPDKTFLVWEPFSGARRSWSYAGFAAETRAYAAGLLAHGVTADDAVVLHMDNCPEFLLLWHACARVGALVVTTNTNSSVDELRYFIEHSRAAVVVTQPGLLPAVRATDPSAHSFRFFAGGAGNTHAYDRWSVASMTWYGMTETVSQVIHSDWQSDEALMSMRRVASEYQISVRREDGSEADSGERGRLWVKGRRGVSLFAEYLDAPEATAAAFDADGYFDTGDDVTGRADGEIFYASRAKDMLKVGAENVAALEIELVLLGVPGVVEVAVVGKPDPMLDEVPVAFVVAAAGAGTDTLEAALYALCQERLSAFKRPRQIRFVESLPKALLGKVLKKDLRDILAAETGVT